MLTAIDDMVWERDPDDRVFKAKFDAYFDGMSFHEKWHSTAPSGRILNYVTMKAAEHSNTVQKLKNIQAGIVDVSVRLSIEPLLVHYQRIASSYTAINKFLLLR
jgi:hypothetical protein